MKKIKRKLSDTLWHIEESSEQVQTSSNQVALGAQTLAQGSTEQAASIEELVTTINGLSERIKNNADDARVAKAFAGEARTDVTESNEQMQDLLDGYGRN